MKEMSRLNREEGKSLQDLSDLFDIPKSTLTRYFHKHQLPIICSLQKYQKSVVIRQKTFDFKCSDSWKRALVGIHGHKCMVCNYQIIVEAHHILPRSEGGRMTIDNGILLCPNHHAEAHAGLFDIIALTKSGELLEKPEMVNQQPSLRSSPKWVRRTRAMEGSETRVNSKEETPRAPDTQQGDDIVRTANIIK